MIRWLTLVFVLTPFLMLFLPWQQNVQGLGHVSALQPNERPQTVDAPVDGRVMRWHVQEGDVVEQGQLLLDMTDIDPLFFQRLDQQQQANQDKLNAQEQQLAAYRQQIQQLRSARDMKVLATEYKRDMAEQKLRSAHESLAATLASRDTAQLQFNRLESLLADGLISRREFELAKRDLEIAERKRKSDQASVQSAQAALAAAQADIAQIRAETAAKVDSATATMNKIESEIADMRKTLVDNDIKISRQSARQLRAPVAGRVLRLWKNPSSQVIKKGQALLTLVPNPTHRAVEVWVSGNDAPLILPGDHTRLMFEGWPAVQFVGWPEVAIGTFGGTVSFVDASQSKDGKFRVLIVPDESDHLWPSERFLRQGGAVKAWILLKQVSLGYEIWRQLNGFPPTLTLDEPNKDLRRTKK
ncbi:MAG: HlyD family efflux transporter periplasmic adaptor subunit [Methylococcales bacterium]|nr:HlyD family efflux transporter periplasmic adaptor subunit [Methylococcales bacterium]